MDDFNPNENSDKLFETEPVLSTEAVGFSSKLQKDKFLGGSSESDKVNITKTLEQVLTREQLDLMETERGIGKISLKDDGKIDIPDDKGETDSETLLWQAKEGVIDAKKYNGTLAVVFNARKRVPEGCPADLMARGRSGEYHASSNIAFTDLSNTFNFLTDKYEPSWEQQILRHELRHGMVSTLDQKRHEETESELRRVVDQELLRTSDPELARQLGYLDELHSQYLDVIDGDVYGHSAFREIDSPFSSIEGKGTHLEVASTTTEGKEAAKDLFLHLQGIILLKRMNEQTIDPREDIDNLAIGAGAVLSTERSLIEADNKIKSLWQGAMKDPDVVENFKTFIKTYEPSVRDNTPIVSQELQATLFPAKGASNPKS